jgi:hypothetical protein
VIKKVVLGLAKPVTASVSRVLKDVSQARDRASVMQKSMRQSLASDDTNETYQDAAHRVADELNMSAEDFEAHCAILARGHQRRSRLFYGLSLAGIVYVLVLVFGFSNCLSGTVALVWTMVLTVLGAHATHRYWQVKERRLHTVSAWILEGKLWC